MAMLLQEMALANRPVDLEAIRQELLHNSRIGITKHAGSARLADELLRPLDHAVPLARLRGEHLAGSRYLEALFRPALGFHLGHFASFQNRSARHMAGHLFLSRLLEKRLEPPRHALTPGGSMRRKLRAKAQMRKWKRGAVRLSDFREFSLTGR
jgi:hypothetical protein